MNRTVLAGVVGLVAGVAISACMVNREGAPCVRDDNCPRSQYCDLVYAPGSTATTGACRELTPALEADDACQLVLTSLAQKFSDCAGGRPQDWMEAFSPQQICATYAGSLSAARVTYAPMQLKVCRAALFADACGDLASRKAGQMLADCALYAGTVAAAGQCATDKDCAGGWCDTNAGCLGTCRAFVPESGACTGTDVCAPGTVCTQGTCRGYITSGPCTADGGVCEPFEHYCRGGQCVLREPSGTAGCDYTGAGNFCQPNLNCVGALLGTKSCLRGIALDQPCTPFTNSCDRFTICATRDGGANLCTLAPVAGAGCGLSPPPGAQDLVVVCRESRCNGFTCVSYAGFGQGCGNNADCGPIGRCVNGACRAEFCQ